MGRYHAQDHAVVRHFELENRQSKYHEYWCPNHHQPHFLAHHFDSHSDSQGHYFVYFAKIKDLCRFPETTPSHYAIRIQDIKAVCFDNNYVFVYTVNTSQSQDIVTLRNYY